MLKDFKRAAWGTADFILEGKGGERVTLAVGECIKDGTINRTPGGSRVYLENLVVLKPGLHSYHFIIPVHHAPAGLPRGLSSPLAQEITPFRYTEVRGNCKVIDIVRNEIFPKEFNDNDAEYKSSSPILNQVWEMCKYSMKATAAFGFFIDGERERAPYEGDAYINQLGWFCTCANGTIPKRTIEYLFEHPTWPFEWFLLMPKIVHDYLLYTGDFASVRQWLPKLDKYLLPDFTDEDGLIRENRNSKIRALIDWPETERDDYHMQEVNLVPNCYLYGALNTMKDLTGKKKYSLRAAVLRDTIRKKMFCKGRFVDSVGSIHTALHSLIFPLFFGVGTISECQGIEDCGMDCSVYSAQFLLETCYRNQMEQHAFELMSSKDLRSWYNMILKGSTISMEAWDNVFKLNQDWNHAWGAAPANIIPRFIGGIRPIEAGFKKFVFEPKTAGLTEFYLRHPTLQGPVEVEFDGKSFMLSIPKGATAVYQKRELKSGKHKLTKIVGDKI